MHTLEIPEANIKRSYPSDLSECNATQYINMCNLLFLLDTKAISFEALKSQAVYFLLNLKPSKKTSSKEEDLKFGNVALIAETIESFFEVDADNNKVLKQYYTHNPIEKIKGATKNYFGPSNEFENISFGEYIDALEFFYDFVDTKDMQYLYLLMATFYRPKRNILKRITSFKADKRKPYNKEFVPVMAKKLKHQNIGVVYGFFMFFTSFQKYLTTAKIYVQGKELDLSILYKDFPTTATFKSSIPGIGMKSILYSISQSGIFGPLEKVRAAPFWEIIIRMYEIRKNDLDAYEQHKNSQKNA